jgi:hypothetical protein
MSIIKAPMYICAKPNLPSAYLFYIQDQNDEL